MERRLVAIVAADIAGYSARMGADEIAALTDLRRIRTVFTNRIQERGGRLFATAGDGFLAEFASPVAAVRAGFEVQRDLLADIGTSPELRIGIHLADVIVEGDNLLGDGVNIAARIEAAAKPGSVTVSRQIFDQVSRTAYLAFEDLGAQQLKNISEPVHLYRVVGELHTHSYVVAPIKDSDGAPMPPVPRAGKPGIVVLPFLNNSGDTEQDYFADGLSEDLMIALARFRSLLVISRNASFSYKGRQIDPRQVGRELGVDHCLEGSVRRLGDRIRVSAQLIRTASGEQAWVDRTDCSPAEVFHLQDELANRIASTIVGRIESNAISAARRKRPADLDAYDCMLRGLEYHRQGSVTREFADKAVEWFDKAIAKDPDYGRAHAWRACAVAVRGDNWLPTTAWWEDCVSSATQALALDDDDEEVHRINGEINLYLGNFEKAEYHFLRAVEINPNHAYIIARAAELYNCLGNGQKALDLLERAKQLDPFLPDHCREEEAVAYYVLGRYGEIQPVITQMQRLTRRAAAFKAAAAIHNVSAPAIASAAIDILRIDPAFSVTHFLDSAHFRDRDIAQRLAADLQAAGLPS